MSRRERGTRFVNTQDPMTQGKRTRHATREISERQSVRVVCVSVRLALRIAYKFLTRF